MPPAPDSAPALPASRCDRCTGIASRNCEYAVYGKKCAQCIRDIKGCRIDGVDVPRMYKAYLAADPNARETWSPASYPEPPRSGDSRPQKRRRTRTGAKTLPKVSEPPATPTRNEREDSGFGDPIPMRVRSQDDVKKIAFKLESPSDISSHDYQDGPGVDFGSLSSPVEQDQYKEEDNGYHDQYPPQANQRDYEGEDDGYYGPYPPPRPYGEDYEEEDNGFHDQYPPPQSYPGEFELLDFDNDFPVAGPLTANDHHGSNDMGMGMGFGFSTPPLQPKQNNDDDNSFALPPPTPRANWLYANHNVQDNFDFDHKALGISYGISSPPYQSNRNDDDDYSFAAPPPTPRSNWLAELDHEFPQSDFDEKSGAYTGEASTNQINPSNKSKMPKAKLTRAQKQKNQSQKQKQKQPEQQTPIQNNNFDAVEEQEENNGDFWILPGEPIFDKPTQNSRAKEQDEPAEPFVNPFLHHADGALFDDPPKTAHDYPQLKNSHFPPYEDTPGRMERMLEMDIMLGAHGVGGIGRCDDAAEEDVEEPLPAGCCNEAYYYLDKKVKVNSTKALEVWFMKELSHELPWTIIDTESNPLWYRDTASTIIFSVFDHTKPGSPSRMFALRLYNEEVEDAEEGVTFAEVLTKIPCKMYSQGNMENSGVPVQEKEWFIRRAGTDAKCDVHKKHFSVVCWDYFTRE